MVDAAQKSPTTMAKVEKKYKVQKECGICCEDFNKSLNKVIVCNHCDYKACRSCCKRYILGSFNEPKCMNCKKDWTKAFLVDNFTKSWVFKEYKNHRENVLWDRQKALLPATQTYVESRNQIKHNTELEKKIRKDSEEVLREIDNNQRRLAEPLQSFCNRAREKYGPRVIDRHARVYHIRTSFLDNKEKSEYQKLFGKYNKVYTEYLNTKREMMNSCNILNNNSVEHKNFINGRRDESPGKPVLFQTDKKVEKKFEKEVIHGKCQVENCRGFIGRGWKCGVCEVKVCSQCMEPKEDKKKHECNPDTVKTIQEINKDSKLCPGCGLRVSKVQNTCYQMWCTQCHTLFHYNTGEIIKNERIHNPHYAEYRRRNKKVGNRNQNMECGAVQLETLQERLTIPVSEEDKNYVEVRTKLLKEKANELQDQMEHFKNLLRETEFERDEYTRDGRPHTVTDTEKLLNKSRIGLRHFNEDLGNADAQRDIWRSFKSNQKFVTLQILNV